MVEREKLEKAARTHSFDIHTLLCTKCGTSQYALFVAMEPYHCSGIPSEYKFVGSYP